MEAWLKVWNVAAKLLPTRGLGKLLKALQEDSEMIVQGATTVPPPLMCAQDFPCEGGCLISFPFAFDGDDPATVGATEEDFARTCHAVDGELGEPAAIRFLLNAFDEWPRETMRQTFIPLVQAELEGRDGECHARHAITR